MFFSDNPTNKMKQKYLIEKYTEPDVRFKLTRPFGK